MPIFVSCPKALLHACWGQEKLGSIFDEAAKKRIKCYYVSSRAELLAYESAYLAEPSSLVIIPGNEQELLQCRAEFADLPLHIILFAHHDHDILESEFSYVMSDFSDAMQRAVKHLRGRGCEHLALFSVNPRSYHDCCREKTFRRFSGMETPLVFSLRENRLDNVKQLLAMREPIDALLCVNDVTALSLMPLFCALDADWNRKMLLLGFSDTVLGALHRPSLTSFSLGFAEGGAEVVHIHRAVQKNPQLACMHAIMKTTLFVRDTTAAEAPRGICFADYPRLPDAQIDALYASGKKLMCLENLLRSCDRTDYRLMLALMDGMSQGEMAEHLYLTVDSIKYRVRKLKRMLGISTVRELATFLCKWLDRDRMQTRAENPARMQR